MPKAVAEEEEVQALSAEQQRRLRRVVEILLAGYRAWLNEQTPDKE